MAVASGSRLTDRAFKQAVPRVTVLPPQPKSTIEEYTYLNVWGVLGTESYDYL